MGAEGKSGPNNPGMAKHQRNRYEFFLSEIFASGAHELGHFIELLRAAGHLKEIQKMLMDTSLIGENDEASQILHNIRMESRRIILFNLSAAYLREALKLFSVFTESGYCRELLKEFDVGQIENARILKQCVDEYGSKEGFLYAILKPLRDKVFHYDYKAAYEWGKMAMANERDEKPACQRIDLDTQEFELGQNYDEFLFTNHLIWSKTEADNVLAAQEKLWQVSDQFVKFVIDVTETLMRTHKIPKNRPLGWLLTHRYGFEKA